MLAQAMGQELTAGRDIEMCNQQLSAAGSAAQKQSESAEFGAILNLIGQTIGAGASAYRKGK